MALARAVYQDKEIVLLDDPFAAVDASVAAQLYSRCVNGLLKRKTRILVSHNFRFLRNCDRVIVLKDGEIAAVGSPQKVLDLPELKEAGNVEQRPRRLSLKRYDSSHSSENLEDEEGEEDDEDEENGEAAALREEEDKESGTVKLGVHLDYFRAYGWLLFVTVVTALFLNTGNTGITLKITA